MIDPQIAKEINSFNELISTVITQSKTLKSLEQVEPELIEDLQQIVIGLHYTMQTLIRRLELSKTPSSDVPATGFSLSFRKNTRTDNPPIDTDGKHAEKSIPPTTSRPI